MKEKLEIYNTLIVGAGPAGTGPFLCAARKNKLAEFLDGGVAIVDKGSYMGSGAIGNYIVNSDTYTTVFLECLEGQKEGGILENVVDLEVTRRLEEYRETSAPLELVGEFMKEVGKALQAVIERHPTSQFFPETEVISLHLSADGTITAKAIAQIEGESVTQEFGTRKIVLAIGGKQHQQKIFDEALKQKLHFKERFAHKVLLSDFTLTPAGVEEMQSRLQKSRQKKVAIVGGAHSAFAAAWTLLNKVQRVDFSEGDIKIIHKNKVKLCYSSREEALEDGYTDFTEEDICPATKKVHRLGGIRTNSKELFRQVMGWSKEGQEKRISLIEMPGKDDNLTEIETNLNEAALIIYACGYDTNILPIYNSEGMEIELFCDRRGPRIDDRGRVLLKNGTPLSNVFATGLCAGFRYSEKLGGEKTFQGEINGVWIYQNTIGEIILNEIL